MSFFAELKRRNVFRVALAYAITAWLVAQVLQLWFESFGTPDWVMKTILVLMTAGFMFTVIFAWAFELTPEGIKREAEVDRSDSIRSDTGKKLDRTITIVLVLAVAYFAWEARFSDTAPAEPSATVSETSGTPAVQAPAPAPAQSAPSVAILPFVNMSADPDQEYFSDGITEEIINAVVKIPGIAVPARTSVFGYKGHQGDVRQVGEELGVTHILEGSVRSQGKQVRITAQLIKVDDGFHLWSETFDRSLENIFVVQEEIASSIADVLVGELGVSVAPVPNRTADMQAYDVYLKGRAALRQRDGEAIALFEQAVAADPGFAPAWAGLAIAYQSIVEDNSKAMDAARKALDIDPDNVDALDALASTLRDAFRWTEAEALYDRALSIDPNSAELLEDYAEFLAHTGRTEEALQVTTRGLAIDHNLWPLQIHHVEMLLANGRLEGAHSFALEAYESRKDPKIRWWYGLLPAWLSLKASGDFDIPPIPGLPADPPPPDEAKEWHALVSRAMDNASEQTIAGLKRDYAADSGPDYRSGWRPWSGRVLLLYLGETDHVVDVDVAQIGMEGETPLYWLWAPLAAELRAHPRFAEYLEKARLIDYWDATRWPDWCKREANGAVTCQ